MAPFSLQAAILSQRLGAFVDQRRPLRHGQPLPMLLAGDFNSLWRKMRSDTFDEASRVQLVMVQCRLRVHRTCCKGSETRETYAGPACFCIPKLPAAASVLSDHAAAGATGIFPDERRLPAACNRCAV